MSVLGRYANPHAYLSVGAELLATLSANRELIVELTRRELVGRHSSQFLGPMWIFVRPMFIAILYIFIFAVVFRARVDVSNELPLDHTAYILAGILPWLAFQTLMNQSCMLIVGNAGLLKDFIFRVELLPVTSSLASIAGQLLGTLLLLVYVGVVHHVCYLTWLLLPLLVLMQVMAMIGVAFMLSALTVVVRDTLELVQMFSMIGVFVTPIVYQREWVPATVEPLLYVNPFSYMVWCYQDALYYGQITNPAAWAVFLGLSVGSLLTGYRIFRFMKPYFGDFV
ncbi:MAG: ABC transporter permease [Gammaproteobacteria bacterium]|nr:ABC transporter permease [Gammaproteobacteria bacterium]